MYVVELCVRCLYCTQHGKDFGRILHFMQTKHKKKQDAFIGNLNRNQVSI